MISFLKGKIIKKLLNYIIIDVNNIGYKVFVNEKFLERITEKEEISIFTHQHIREDSVALYGFAGFDELELFELLLSISGIGPKSALASLAIASPEDLKTSIASGDPSLLTKVSGIGKKTAERVVLELKDKIATITFSKTGERNTSVIGNDEIDALMSLGYSLQQSRDALSQISPDIKGSGARIKEALKIMR